MADADAVSVRVVARFRPYNEKELALNMATTTYKFIGDECVNVNVRNMSSNIGKYFMLFGSLQLRDLQYY